MRRLLVIISLLGIFLSAEARMKHPSLLFTPERTEHAKTLMKRDSLRSDAWQTIKAEADRTMARRDVMKMEYQALAFLMTGDTSYADYLKSMLLEISEIESWENDEMMQRNPPWRSELQMAHRAFQIAMAYDAVYNTLTPEDRAKIARGMWRLAASPLLGDWLLEPSRIHSLNSMGHNWWSSCVGMGGLLALALSDELPEAAEAARKAVESLPQWFDFPGDKIQKKPRNFDRSGGMYESINYASFGITEALVLRQAWLNSHPGSSLPEITQIEKLPEFFAHVSYPRTGQLYSLNFGDSHKNVTGESSMLLAYAQGVRNPVTLWYASQIEPGQHREGYPITFPMGFLYTPDLSDAPTEPGLPESCLWEDFGWATMRDSWSPDATMLAVKSGMTWNHSHADANSFILFHNGVDIIKDAGNCSYGKPEYRNYFFQSEAHNVVRFNGEGQPRKQQYYGSPLPGSVSTLIDAGDVKYVMADGTGPMSKSLSRNLRHFLWIDSVIYIIDDLVSHEPGHFEWLWHPGGNAEKRGGDIIVSRDNSRAVIRPLYPQPLAPSNFVHDYPDMLYWETVEAPTEDLQGTETYWELHLPGVTDRVKGVTAVITGDNSGHSVVPRMERREGKDWIGIRTRHNGKITDLYINQLADGRLMHLNSWIEADGIVTDAYLFAVTYPENELPLQNGVLTMIYGSALRHDGKVIHSSLSKESIVADIADGRLRIRDK